MLTIGLTGGPQVEIISAYAATNQQITADEDGDWYVVGAFFMPITATVRLELIGAVSEDGDQMGARLFSVEDAEPVTGSTTADVDALTDERALSNYFELEGGKLYQMQAHSVGTGYGIIRSCSLVQ